MQVGHRTGKRVERTHEPSERCGIAARKLPVARVDEPVVMRLLGEKRALAGTVVTHVLGYERAPLTLRGREISIRCPSRECRSELVNRGDVVAAATQLDVECRRVHLVEEESQASSSRSRARAALSL